MMRFNINSIKTKIVIYFAILILIPSGFLAYISLNIAEKAITTEVDDALVEIVKEGAKVAESRIDIQKETIEVISNMLEIVSMDWSKQLPILQRYKDMTEFLALAVVTPDGTAHYDDNTTAELGDREYVKKAFNGELNVSDIIISRVTNETVLMYAAPIKKDGKVAGVLIGRRDGNFLSDLINDITHGETGYAYLINDEGIIVAHKDKEKVFEQWNPIEEAINDKKLESLSRAMQKMIDEKVGSTTYILENKKMYNSFAPIEGTNWVMGIAVEAKEVLSSISHMQKLIFIILLFVIIIGIIAISFIGKSFTTPILVSIDHALLMAKGDFTREVDKQIKDRKDELGAVAGAFFEMQDSLRGLIKDVLNISETVGATAEELSASIQEISSNAQNQSSGTEEVSSTMEEMTANIHLVSENVQTTSQNADVIVKTMDEIEDIISDNTKNLEEINHSINDILGVIDNNNKSINFISKSSKAASKEAEETVRLAGEGKENLNKSVEQMGSIQTTILNLSNVIGGLGESASQIGEITDLIKDIAEQTNLLALNASIEAARAGEHGKGFAVVAQAIGNLADESSNATKEIAVVIKNIQSEITKAVQSSKEGTEVVESGTNLVKDTSSSLDKIFEAIKSTANVINEITEQMDGQSKETQNIHDAATDINTKANNLMAAMEEETASTIEIKNKINSIDEIIKEINSAMKQQTDASEQVTTAVNENAAGIEAISLSSAEIAKSSEELAINAQKLVEHVKQFKV